MAAKHRKRIVFESAAVVADTQTDNPIGAVQDHVDPLPEDHYGLLTMRERAEELHGTLAVSTAVGRGSVVEVTVPLEPTIAHSILA